jgi:hypothetical protein
VGACPREFIQWDAKENPASVTVQQYGRPAKPQLLMVAGVLCESRKGDGARHPST